MYQSNSSSNYFRFVFVFVFVFVSARLNKQLGITTRRRRNSSHKSTSRKNIVRNEPEEIKVDLRNDRPTIEHNTSIRFRNFHQQLSMPIKICTCNYDDKGVQAICERDHIPNTRPINFKQSHLAGRITGYDPETHEIKMRVKYLFDVLEDVHNICTTKIRRQLNYTICELCHEPHCRRTCLQWRNSAEQSTLLQRVGGELPRTQDCIFF
jgi:hypothetical protein